jgi:uncharacterized protein (TIGR02145 family)
MKKLISLILGISLVYSCSTSSDGNGNTTVVPAPPSNLTGVIASTTQINLSWTDNSTNETGFKIERKTGTGAYAVVGFTEADITTFNDTDLTPSTAYSYRVYSSNAIGDSLTSSNELTLTTTSEINLPTLTTIAVTSIDNTTAVSGGTISGDGGGNITARGVCWSTNINPTIDLSTKTSDGVGTGAFTSAISALVANTTYYARAYATNSAGTAYGNQVSFITTQINITGPNASDIDGNIYQTVTNCIQTWMKTNLNVSKYRNGDIIPQVTDPQAWGALTTGAWCYYANTSSNGTTYGKLYNWYAVNDPRGLSPSGWHVPTKTEWDIITNCLGGPQVAGGSMKEAGSIHWNSPNIATNNSGFTALPGGLRDGNGIFSNINYNGYWWS